MGATYVISDIHGNYNAYMDMLKKIQFDDDDILYILGDILDRGPNPIQVILDVMKRPNVEMLAGNHCVMALECLSFLRREITLEASSFIFLARSATLNCLIFYLSPST